MQLTKEHAAILAVTDKRESDERKAHPFTTRMDGVDYLVGTDGHAMACLPVPLEAGDVHGMIPREALDAVKATKAKHPINVKANGTVTVETLAGTLSFNRPDSNPFNLAGIVPKAEESDVVICLNPELLMGLAKALGTVQNGLTLRLKVENSTTLKPLHVQGMNGWGLLMPLQIGK